MAYFKKTPFSVRKTIYPNRKALLYKRFKVPLRLLRDGWVTRIKKERDGLVLITGTTGSGKSTLMAWLAFNYFGKTPNPMLNDSSMMYEDKNFIINIKELAAKMITNKGALLWLDEGRDIADRQRWFDQSIQLIISRKNKNRKHGNLYFILMPFEVEVNPRISAHLCAWIWVKKRGLGELYLPPVNEKGGKGLDIQGIIDREVRWKKENPGRLYVPQIIHPEFRGYVIFAKMNKKMQKRYNKLVEANHAVGELSEEEKLEFGIIEKIAPEKIINTAITKIRNLEFKSKRELWHYLVENFPNESKEKIIKDLNFYLKLEGLDPFSKLYTKDKSDQIDVEW